MNFLQRDTQPLELRINVLESFIHSAATEIEDIEYSETYYN